MPLSRIAHLQWIKKCCRFLFKLLSFIQLHLRLEDIIYQRMRSSWVFEEVSFVQESLFYELIHKGETHFDLHAVMVFNIDPQILNIQGFYGANLTLKSYYLNTRSDGESCWTHSEYG
jgi:hypothetical protein